MKLTNEECLTMFDIFEKFIFVILSYQVATQNVFLLNS